MTGYRPGIYWQLTWRYIGPAIMGCILVSSIVFMFIENPTYSAWNAEEVFIYIFYYYNYLFIDFYKSNLFHFLLGKS